MNLINKSLIAIILIGSMTLGFGAANIACTKTEQAQVASAIMPTAACIADVVLATTGIEDPFAIATACGTAVADVYVVVSELLDNSPKPEAGVMTAMSLNNRAHLERIRARAHAIMVDSGLTQTLSN
jgi:hypothetical protein